MMRFTSAGAMDRHPIRKAETQDAHLSTRDRASTQWSYERRARRSRTRQGSAPSVAFSAEASPINASAVQLGDGPDGGVYPAAGHHHVRPTRSLS